VAIRAALAGAICATVLIAPATAQRNKFDGLRQCEHYAASQFRRHNAAFRRFVIDRTSATDDKFADHVGAQFVSTIYHGKATYEAGTGPKTVRFICLHAGYKKGPVFVYTMGE
jgi:hypothetical protein